MGCRLEIDCRRRSALLLVDVHTDHLVSRRAAADGEIAPSPEVPSPEHAPKLGVLLQQDPRADPLEPLPNLAHLLRRPIRDQHVHVVPSNLPGNEDQVMLRRDLP